MDLSHLDLPDDTRVYLYFINKARSELKAGDLYQSYHTILQLLHQDEPPLPLFFKGYAYLHLGRVFEEDGQYGKARAAYCKAMGVFGRECKMHPTNGLWVWLETHLAGLPVREEGCEEEEERDEEEEMEGEGRHFVCGGGFRLTVLDSDVEMEG
ncbi:hypothetical protein BJ508DRAFT_303541 [Ascobolus immersus RN42]|uniref:Uncharacterized protein n=1 Tax=Ascobolus immersus RN42 TaxID=1160509 RepID=A0A3N4IG42_ASCIM|nr:hypothetical protein BJ508DRAFT_303541 [Ascobolus immersus RN42]